VLLMATSLEPGVSPDRRSVLARRVRLLVAATISYSVIDAVVAIAAGTAIAVSFFVLAAYVTVESVRGLPGLSYAQRHAGRELGSASAVADSKQTLLCTYLSAVLLAGLVVNSLFGWSWVDPLAALVIAAIAIKEGRAVWRGDACRAVPVGLADQSADRSAAAPGRLRRLLTARRHGRAV
jgi:divalent metal cation (Fe/Co/Zn/Cd) transporter